MPTYTGALLLALALAPAAAFAQNGRITGTDPANTPLVSAQVAFRSGVNSGIIPTSGTLDANVSLQVPACSARC